MSQIAKPAHTPGPWATDAAYVSDRYRYVLADDGMICRITKIGAASESNARLIAAAPEMLEALKEVTKVLSRAKSLSFDEAQF